MIASDAQKPETSFAFSKINLAKIQKIIKRYPEGRQASAVIPLLDLAQRQNGWVSQGVIEAVANILSMPPMRVYEVATFYTMFNLQPVGHYFVQLCTNAACWLRGSEDLVKICTNYLGVKPGEITKDGKFSFKEVECLGACANAPMVQINDDYYEDLDSESFQKILAQLSEGKTVQPGSVKGRQASAPENFVPPPLPSRKKDEGKKP